MRVDVSQLKDWFTFFNGKYFSGQLPEPDFAVGRSRTRLGSLSWRYRLKLFRKTPCRYVLRVSNYYDMDELHFKSVLLHEMIHLYIVSGRLKDTSPHGTLFRRTMTEINADGWCISVSARMSSIKRAASPVKKRRRIVLAVRMTDGKCLLSVVSKRYVCAVDATVKRSPDVCSYSWHTSTDDYFADFPVVRTPRGRVVTKEIYDRMVSFMPVADFS